MKHFVRTTDNKTYVFVGKASEVDLDQFKDFYIEQQSTCSAPYLVFVSSDEALPYLRGRTEENMFKQIVQAVYE